MNGKTSALIEEATKLRKELTRPLDDEKLQFTDKDGKPAGVALLGDRIKRFRKTVVVVEKELNVSWTELDEVQQEIKELAMEMLGPDAMDVLREHLADANGERQADREVINMEQEIEAQKQRLKKEIEEMSRDFIERMNASEKVCRAFVRSASYLADKAPMV